MSASSTRQHAAYHTCERADGQSKREGEVVPPTSDPSDSADCNPDHDPKLVIRRRPLAEQHVVPGRTHSFHNRDRVRLFPDALGSIQPSRHLSRSRPRASVIGTPRGGRGPDEPVVLGDLFGADRSWVMHHFMFGPELDQGCLSCSSAAEGIGRLRQLNVRDTRSWPCRGHRTRSSLRSGGWAGHSPWYSSHGTDFNYDFQRHTRRPCRAGVALVPHKAAAFTVQVRPSVRRRWWRRR